MWYPGSAPSLIEKNGTNALMNPHAHQKTFIPLELEALAPLLRPDWAIVSPEETDLREICRWVKSQKELSLIGGEASPGLTIDILNTWIEQSIEPFVLCRPEDTLPIAFCTLSVVDQPRLPKKVVEICHLVSRPTVSGFLPASRIIDVALNKAWTHGFEAVVGRCVPNNRFAKRAALTNGFRFVGDQLPWPADGFDWCVYPRQKS